MCPIPNFDHNHVLPPYVGNPTLQNDLSPYKCTILELCYRYSITNERIAILKNFISFRIKMSTYGIVTGFQWLDGSFLENIEVSEKRAPNDLDVVTFSGGFDPTTIDQINLLFPEFINPVLSKTKYKLDHYFVDFMFDPFVTVQYTRYWIQLFTHNRKGAWKGIVELPINSPTEDHDALTYLNGLII